MAEGRNVLKEAWIDVPAVMKTEHGEVEGCVKYGIRIPMKPGTTPLVECKPGSREKRGREEATYWFVNDAQDVKIRLVTVMEKEDGTIEGLGRDVENFQYSIRRKE